jgi:hypothetical protein
MMRLESRNALLARAIFASTWSDKCATTLAPTVRAGARKARRTQKTNRLQLHPCDMLCAGACLTRSLCCTRGWNHSAKLLRKAEVRGLGPVLLKPWLRTARA